jgi:hypothetical protein
MTTNGPILTDANNKTGNISEFGKDANAYLNYLSKSGVPIEMFKNIPKSASEEAEEDKLGKENKDTRWFNLLSHDEKSKYIGRGHTLTNEQFDRLWNNKVFDLLNQYVNIGKQLEDYQLDKILTNNNLKNSYLRGRLIGDEAGFFLNRKEFSNLPPDKQKELSDKLYKIYDIKTAISIATRYGDINLINRLIERSGDNERLIAIASALDIASQREYEDIVNHLLAKTPKLSAISSSLENAIMKNNFNIVKSLVNYTIASNNKYIKPVIATSIEAATAHGAEDILNYLLDEYEKIAQKGEYDYILDATLEVAVVNDNKVAMNIAINRGAVSFDNALVAAASMGNIDIVKFMIEKGARNFEKAMGAARRGLHRDVIQLIKSYSQH